MHKQAWSHTLWTPYILPLLCTYQDNVLYIFFSLCTAIPFSLIDVESGVFLLWFFFPRTFALSWSLFLILFSYFTLITVYMLCCTHIMLHKLSSTYLSKPLTKIIWSKTIFICWLKYFGYSFAVRKQAAWRMFTQSLGNFSLLEGRAFTWRTLVLWLLILAVTSHLRKAPHEVSLCEAEALRQGLTFRSEEHRDLNKARR